MDAIKKKGADSKWLISLLSLPELNIAFFAFLLHFVWEMWQIPFYIEMKEASHAGGVLFCSLATAGDAVIAVACFWIISLSKKNRTWIQYLSIKEIGWFILLSIGATIILEKINVEMLGRWEYSSAMPLLPFLNVGMVPIIQWIILSPVILFVTARQIKGAS